MSESLHSHGTGQEPGTPGSAAFKTALLGQKESLGVPPEDLEAAAATTEETVPASVVEVYAAAGKEETVDAHGGAESLLRVDSGKLATSLNVSREEASSKALKFVGKFIQSCLT